MYFRLALGNVRKSLRDYGIYFVTLAIGICIFYSFNSVDAQGSLLSMPTEQRYIIESLNELISYVSVVIAIVLGFLVVYANRFLIKRRKREFGLYLTLGMSKRAVSSILVIESLLVGMLSLVTGLVAGFAASQGMLYMTAMLFGVKVETFNLVFSQTALVNTIVCFAVMFAIALVFNVMTVAHTSVIKLINASRINEQVKLRNLPLSVVLFVVSLCMIGYAYYLLQQNGLYSLGPDFLKSALIVFAGTFLFFYSLSGFLLRVCQLLMRSYFKGLNMFVFRQLNSKVNTAFASVSIVSIVLFFALTSTCGGFALCAAFNDSLEKSTVYDASVTIFPFEDDTEQADSVAKTIKRYKGDTSLMLSDYMPRYSELVVSSAQMDTFESSVTFNDYLSGLDGAKDLEGSGAMDEKIQITGISQLNAMRSLQGLEKLHLDEGQYMVSCDVGLTKDAFNEAVAAGRQIVYRGHTLVPADLPVDETLYTTSTTGMNVGTLVVSDDLLPSYKEVYASVVNMMLVERTQKISDEFFKSFQDGFAESVSVSYSVQTAVDVRTQSFGITALVTYLAIYIGLVFLIACAAILALQQLSESADSARRYALLRDLGAESSMLSGALAKQIGIYFLFPLLLAVCHSYVALGEVLEVAKFFGKVDLAGPLALTVAFALAIYGGYYLLTFFGSKAVVLSRSSR